MGLIAAVALSSAAERAEAQSTASFAGSTGLDSRLFRPAIDTKGHFMVNGTDILGANQYAFGLIIDGAGGIVPYHGFENSGSTLAADADRIDRLIGVQFTGNLMFNYGIANWLVVGANVPITFVRGPDAVIPNPAGGAIYNNAASPVGLSSQGFGDLGLNLKLRLLRSETQPIGLAILVRATFPTGRSDAFTGDSGVTLWPSLVLEYRHRRIRLSGEVGLRMPFGDTLSNYPILGRSCPALTADPTNGNCGGSNPPAVDSATGAVEVRPGRQTIDYGSLLTFGLGASIHLGANVDFVAEGYGSQLVTQFGETGSLSMEALGGFKFFIHGHNYLMLAGGAGIPIDDGFQQANWRGVLGVVFEPSIADRDGDGIRDDVDECPDEPEDFDDFEDEDGCPEPDNDRDGILDVDDQCIDVPEDRDGVEDEDGCPEGGDFDRDRDGIPDSVDNCPDDPEDMDGFEDTDGCPDPDNDHDGIVDGADQCPSEPEDYDTYQDEDGCPDADNDQDRIVDDVDRCPNEPETYNGTDDADGCPDRGLVVLEENQLLILEKIYFETNSAVIQRRSLTVIDAVAATLIGNPQIRKLEVQGHADERGNDDYNLRLTRDRAAAVVEALVQRGVPRDRLQSAGYGELCPINPARNAAAYDQNRRVEFTIVENEFGPTGVLGGCEAGAHLRPH